MQAVYTEPKPDCRELCSRGEGCLSGVGIYLPGTVLQGWSLFKWCQKLPARHSVAGVQAALAVSESTCRALCCRGKGCLRGVGTYLPGTVLQGCRLFK